MQAGERVTPFIPMTLLSLASHLISDTSQPTGLHPDEGVVVALVRPRRFNRFFGLGLALGLLLLLVVDPGIAASQTAASQREPSMGRLANQPFVRMTGDMLGYELVPNFNGTYKGAPFQTNRWGMRDRDYTLVPPPRTYRIALVGSSFTMGGGVPEEKTLKALLEDRLNREATTPAHRHYEILNFSVGGYRGIQYGAVLAKKVFPFSPNAVFIVIHPGTMSHLFSLLRNRIPIEDATLRQLLQKGGIEPGMEEPELRRRLAPLAPDIERRSYERIAEICRQHGVPVFAIVFPEPRDDKAVQAAAAVPVAQAGIPLIHLDGVYSGRSYESVRLPGDIHLNALGHQLVADRLYQFLRKDDPLGLWVKH
jgi:hypothetical protein